MEGLIYKISDYLTQENFIKFSQEIERFDLDLLAKEHDEWMYSNDMMHSDFKEFNKRHDEMDKII